MRCPECSQRNSVAARKCNACGKVLPRKPLPLPVKIFLGGVVGIGFALCMAALSTTIDSPEKALKRAAREITGKSRSAEQATDNFRHFDQAAQALLKKFGALSTTELRKKLAESLPKSLYEAHVFELLPDVKLVEFDTVLNVADYLVLLRDEKPAIVPVVGLFVYDSSSFLPQTSTKQEGNAKPVGQMLVLIGHTAGSNGRHPTAKVLFLSANRQPDGIIDMTDNIVPKFYGEGSAKLAANQKDIDLSVTLLSRGKDMKLFAVEQSKPLPLEDETLYDQLIWANNHYNLRSQPGASKLYALYAAMAALENHHKLWRYQAYLTPNVRHFIERSPIIFASEGFVIQGSKRDKSAPATAGSVYTLSDGIRKITAVIKYVPAGKKNTEPGGKWIVEGLASSAEAKPLKQVVSQPTPIPTPVVKTEQPVIPAPVAKTEQPVTPAPVAQQPAAPPAKAAPEPDAVEKTAEEKIIPCSLKASLFPDIKATIKIRSGPGTIYPIVSQLKPGSAITMTGRSGSWCQVVVDGKQGYVFGGFINTGSSIAGGYRSAKVTNPSPVKDEKDHTIAYVHRGEHMVIVGSNGKQYKVMLVDGRSGLLDKEAIDSTPAPRPVPKPAPVATTSPTAQTVATTATHIPVTPPMHTAPVAHPHKRTHVHAHVDTPPPLVP